MSRLMRQGESTARPLGDADFVKEIGKLLSRRPPFPVANCHLPTAIPLPNRELTQLRLHRIIETLRDKTIGPAPLFYILMPDPNAP